MIHHLATVSCNDMYSQVLFPVCQRLSGWKRPLLWVSGPTELQREGRYVLWGMLHPFEGLKCHWLPQHGTVCFCCSLSNFIFYMYCLLFTTSPIEISIMNTGNGYSCLRSSFWSRSLALLYSPRSPLCLCWETWIRVEGCPEWISSDHIPLSSIVGSDTEKNNMTHTIFLPFSIFNSFILHLKNQI